MSEADPLRKFQRKRGMITTKLSAYEVELLSSLIMQLVELITDGEPEVLTSFPKELVMVS